MALRISSRRGIALHRGCSLWLDRRAWHRWQGYPANDPFELAGNVTGKGVSGSIIHYTMVALRMHEETFGSGRWTASLRTGQLGTRT